jgi:CheY-like chemotaxis protein
MGEYRFRILLVEDNAGDVYLLRKALEEAQVTFDLTVLEDGAQALAFVRSEHPYADRPIPDLTVLDLNLPKYEGTQVLAAYHQNPRFAGVPVIVMSSSTSPRDRAEAARLGIDGYFQKPADFDEFMKLGHILKEVLMRTVAAK